MEGRYKRRAGGRDRDTHTAQRKNAQRQASDFEQGPRRHPLHPRQCSNETTLAPKQRQQRREASATISRRTSGRRPHQRFQKHTPTRRILLHCATQPSTWRSTLVDGTPAAAQPPPVGRDDPPAGRRTPRSSCLPSTPPPVFISSPLFPR